MIEFKMNRIDFGKVREIPCFLLIKQENCPIIDLNDPEFGEVTFQGEDLFDSLVLVRKFFESKGYLLMCAGSMPNAYPSRMSRQMSNGRKAYLHFIGKKPSFENMIDIFSPVTADQVGTLKKQNEFMARWYAQYDN